jgi:hypothetical protein
MLAKQKFRRFLMRKNMTKWLVMIFLFLALGQAKSGFEYGGTTLFLENQQYQDGYDKDDHQLIGVNKYFTQRVYVTGYYHINDNNKVRLTLDKLSWDKDSNGYDYHSDRVIAKYLYLESKGLLGFDKVYLGQIETPWIGFEDKIWGKRFMEKSLLDSQGITNSADRGIGVMSKVGLNGEYHLAIVGGEGYKVRDLDGKYNIEGRYTLKFSDKLSTSVGGGTGWKALAGDSKVPSKQDWDYTSRVDYLVGNINYKVKNDLILSLTAYDKHIGKDDVEGVGISGTGDLVFTHSSGSSLTLIKSCPKVKGLDWVARLDHNDPNVLTGGDAKNTSIIGASYEINKNITVAYSKHADDNEYATTSPVHTDYLQAQIIF